MILQNRNGWPAGHTVTLVAAVGLLAGCAAMQPDLSKQQQEDLQGNLQAAFGAYQDCMVAESDPYVQVLSAPPADIAEAAQGACESVYKGYETAVTHYFTAVVSSSGRDDARNRARLHASNAALQTRRQIIGRILGQRLESSITGDAPGQ
ncbi:hypothetical protein RE428_14980 [Marinobacter nanhaiticus D15-8W]|uniref:Lipoprotein n=1 Tax=Marinobacter nanhaiticus D15-8W TaxID=626887 RepID=N6WWD4_9GAMM|nr:hypothetical protein [Marinobacter nanhaiticus]ENO13123.1 hypothetical protein J057_17035 [Marinobacter nanhaiticus D15-8W]BES70480.1 hypothetical protein RE428_14980 [Marinobacter nanhaiticus D15-8W]